METCDSEPTYYLSIPRRVKKSKLRQSFSPKRPSRIGTRGETDLPREFVGVIHYTTHVTTSSVVYHRGDKSNNGTAAWPWLLHLSGT